MLLTLSKSLERRGNSVRIANYSGRSGEEPRTSLESIRARLGSIDLISLPAAPVIGRIVPLPSFRGIQILKDAFHWADVVIFGQYYFFDVVIQLLSRLQGRPVVCSQANALFRSYRQALRDTVQEAYARTLGYRLLMACGAVRVCNSEDLRFLRARGYHRAFLLYPTRGEFSAVDVAAKPPAPKGAPATLLQSDSRFKVMVMGRMTHQKGVELLRPMISLMLGTEPRLSEHVVFYFSGTTDLPCEVAELKSRFPSLIVNLGILPQETFASFLAGADVVLVPSLYESFGMVAAEAQALGKPVIATNITGLREIVLDGETGLLVKEWSPGAFAEAIRSLRLQYEQTPELWQLIEGKAFRNYEHKFGSETQLAQFDSLLFALSSLSTSNRSRQSRSD